MADPLYTIALRPDIALLDVAWHGQFDEATVASYTRECKARFLDTGLRPGYILRMDMRGSAVQPQEAVRAFREYMADFPKARRIAVVTHSAIARMQVQREMTQDYRRIFDDADAALAWLLEPEMALD